VAVLIEKEWFELGSGEGPLLCHSGAPRPGEPGIQTAPPPGYRIRAKTRPGMTMLFFKSDRDRA
jgi:hypothetical protein